MAERDLIKAIRKRYAEMGRAKRIKTIQGLSVDGLSFIQKFLPEYYAEAFPEPARMGSERWQSDAPDALLAKPH